MLYLLSLITADGAFFPMVLLIHHPFPSAPAQFSISAPAIIADGKGLAGSGAAAMGNAALGLIATVADQPMELFVALIVIGKGMGSCAFVPAIVTDLIMFVIILMRLIFPTAGVLTLRIATIAVMLRIVARKPTVPIVLMGNDGKGNLHLALIVSVALHNHVAGTDLGIISESNHKVGSEGQGLAV